MKNYKFSFVTETEKSADTWRPYIKYKFAIAGANDTGTLPDSPANSNTARKELALVKSALRKLNIPFKEKALESTNIFMIRWFIVVPEEYVEQGKNLVMEILRQNDTYSLYLA